MIEIAYHFIANHANHATTPSRPPRPPRLPCFPCPRCHSGPFGGFYLWTMHFSLYRTAGVGCQTVIAQCKASWRLHKMSERLWLRAKRSEVFWAKISQSNHIFKRDLWSWFSSEIMIVTPVCKNSGFHWFHKPPLLLLCCLILENLPITFTNLP